MHIYFSKTFQIVIACRFWAAKILFACRVKLMPKFYLYFNAGILNPYIHTCSSCQFPKADIHLKMNFCQPPCKRFNTHDKQIGYLLELGLRLVLLHHRVCHDPTLDLSSSCLGHVVGKVNLLWNLELCNFVLNPCLQFLVV